MADSTNISASDLTTRRRVQPGEIIQLLDLYESDDFFNFWLSNVADSTMAEATKTLMRRHFPRGNWLKRIIQRMVNSLPDFKMKFTKPDGSEMDEKERIEWEQWLKGEFDRSGWEGKDNFKQAKVFWREMLFLTGRLVVKHVAEKDEVTGKMRDCIQRMPQTGIDYKLSDDDRKCIEEWRFAYLSTGGSGLYASQSIMVIETMNANQVLITENGIVEAEKGEPGKTTGDFQIPPEVGIPVSFMAWEKLEGEPLGIPYGRRIAKKLLNILSILTDMRTANRKNSDRTLAFINADGLSEDIGGGGAVQLTSRYPGQQVDVKELGGNLQIDSLFKELENALHDLYEDASLPFPGRDQLTIAPSSSGKALQILSAPMVEYRNAYLPEEKGFVEDMVHKMAIIAGRQIERAQINCIHEPVQQPGGRAKDDDARFFAEYDFIEEALRHKGVDVNQIPQLMKERAAYQALKAKNMLSAFGEPPPVPGEPIDPNLLKNQKGGVNNGNKGAVGAAA